MPFFLPLKYLSIGSIFPQQLLISSPPILRVHNYDSDLFSPTGRSPYFHSSFPACQSSPQPPPPRQPPISHHLSCGSGALGTPVVRTDAAAIWATGRTWWTVHGPHFKFTPHFFFHFPRAIFVSGLWFSGIGAHVDTLFFHAFVNFACHQPQYSGLDWRRGVRTLARILGHRYGWTGCLETKPDGAASGESHFHRSPSVRRERKGVPLFNCFLSCKTHR